MLTKLASQSFCYFIRNFNISKIQVYQERADQNEDLPNVKGSTSKPVSTALQVALMGCSA